MPDKVIDSSAVCALVYVEPEGLDIAKRITGHQLFAPALLQFEVANVCVSKIRQRAAALETLMIQYANFASMQIIVSDIQHQDVLAQAHALGLSFYDASYLWLASHLNLELVTLDKRLASAAAKIGIKV